MRAVLAISALALQILIASGTRSNASPVAPANGPLCTPLFISPEGEPFRSAGGLPPCPIEVWFGQTDANHDGSITRAEFQADAARFFSLLDLNRDGVLEPDEVQRYEQEIVPEILGRPLEATLAPRIVLAQFGGGLGSGAGGIGQPGPGAVGNDLPPPGQPSEEHGPQGSSPDGASQYGLLDEPEPVASADLNFDGLITRAEFLLRASQRFDSLDVDRSGGLTLPLLKRRMDARGGRGTRSRARHGSGRHPS